MAALVRHSRSTLYFNRATSVWISPVSQKVRMRHCDAGNQGNKTSCSGHGVGLWRGQLNGGGLLGNRILGNHGVGARLVLPSTGSVRHLSFFGYGKTSSPPDGAASTSAVDPEQLNTETLSTVSDTIPATQATTLADGYIPEPPPIPELGATGEMAQELTSLGEATLHSLGLANWSPAGLVQMGLENLHVAADLPWWGAIVAGTVCLRLLVFPLVVLAQRNAANMHNTMPTMQRLQEKFSKARSSGNALEAARAGNDLMEFMKVNKVNPMKNMLVPLCQLPIFISVFVGVRQMANLPVESLQTGGLFWFTDLTVADPFYALPLITMATFLATIEIGVDGVRAGSMTNNMRYVMRAMPFVMLPFIINFPTAMLCYWFTSNAFSLVQVLFLKIPNVRTFFNIPELVKHPKAETGKKKNFREGFRESMRNASLAAKMADREKMDAVRFKEAGMGPLQKTYPYDPTKVKSKDKSS